MPYPSTKAKVVLTQSEQSKLEATSRSQTAAVRSVVRAKVLLACNEGQLVADIARDLRIRRAKADQIIDRALAFGALTSLDDLPRPGRPPTIGGEAQAWVTSLACQKPKEFGYPHELWTTRLLATHVRRHCDAKGYPELKRMESRGVSRLLAKNDVKPHKVRYYLDRRDPDFEFKMVDILFVYDEVDLIRSGEKDAGGRVTVSYDEKPGIQATGTTAPDLPPVPGKHQTWSRDHEYVRLGTVTLMAAINLVTVVVHGMVVDRHRSVEFIEFLEMLDAAYADATRIRIAHRFRFHATIQKQM